VSAVGRLAACEQQFVLQMQAGVTHYVTALRHSDVISRTDHDTLFINLETVGTVSLCAVSCKERGATQKQLDRPTDGTKGIKTNDVKWSGNRLSFWLTLYIHPRKW